MLTYISCAHTYVYEKKLFLGIGEPFGNPFLTVSPFFNVFFIVWTIRSMNPFDCRYLGLDVICVNSHSIAKLWNSFDTKYLALSVYRCSGIPCTAKIAFKYSIQLALVTLFIVFTNGILLY